MITIWNNVMCRFNFWYRLLPPEYRLSTCCDRCTVIDMVAKSLKKMLLVAILLY